MVEIWIKHLVSFPELAQLFSMDCKVAFTHCSCNVAVVELWIWCGQNCSDFPVCTDSKSTSAPISKIVNGRAGDFTAILHCCRLAPIVTSRIRNKAMNYKIGCIYHKARKAMSLQCFPTFFMERSMFIENITKSVF